MLLNFLQQNLDVLSFQKQAHFDIVINRFRLASKLSVAFSTIDLYSISAFFKLLQKLLFYAV